MDWLDRGGEMGGRIAAMDWSATPLGPMARWPPSMRAALRLVVESAQPMWLFWGPDLRSLYNDAAIAVTAARHPHALGLPLAEVAAEIWPDVAAAYARAQAGTPAFAEDVALVTTRNGAPEELYFTFSLTPVRVDDGTVGGVLCASVDTTAQVVERRRLETLYAFATRVTGATTAIGASQAAAEALATNRGDVAFALVYLVDASGDTAILAGATGLPADSPAAPTTIELAGTERPATAWPLRRVLRTGRGEIATELGRRFGGEPVNAHTAVVLPLPGDAGLGGFLVVGIAARRRLDAGYRAFLDRLAAQLAAELRAARAIEALHRKIADLAEVDRAKTAFFTNASHELRTPITLLVSPLEDALMECKDDMQRDRLRMAHRNALRLHKMANTLLDFARVEAGRVQAVYALTDLSRLTTEIASSFESACERAGIALVVDCPKLPEQVYVDRLMWEKIVLNLLSNAFKFTFAGRIEVSLRHRDDHVELAVADTGTGIAPHHLARLFDRFYRVEHTRGRTQEGTGIGLALVRDLARRHGGDVRVDSTPQVGSLFTVSIKTGTAHLPTDQIDRGHRVISTTTRTAFAVEAAQWIPDRLSDAVPAGPLGTRPRVLWVEDNADMRAYVRRLLAMDYEVVAVTDGIEALTAIQERRPDLVLADVMLPRSDGVALLRAVRADPRTQGLPVILLSSQAGEDARIAALDAGADEHVVKPFHARELLATVRSQLSLAGIRAAFAERERALDRKADRAERILRALLEHVPAGITMTGGPPDFVVEANSVVATAVLGRAAGDPDGDRAAHHGLYRADGAVPAAEELPLYRAAHHGAVIADEEWMVVRPDGERRTVSVNASPIRGPDGVVLGAVNCWSDITERKRLEESLREADRRKDEFLAMLGHELRNPLSPLRMMIDVLGQRGPDTAATELSRACVIMDRQVRHLVRLVDDLLDVTRIARGVIGLHRNPTDVASVIERALEMAAPLIESRSHHATVSLPIKPLHVDGDPDRLAQVVLNLVVNAARYTEPGGRIAISADREGDHAVIRVKDSGIGIAPDELRLVFDPFVQGERSASHAPGGLGVGLTLVQRLVELHGGTIEARSDGLGTGTELEVRIPALAAVAPGRVPTQPAQQRIAQVERVLVIEDNLDSAEAIAHLLEGLAREVRIARTGPQALDLARDYRPDLVLLDVGLPGMDGYEVARRLRRDLGLVDIIVAAVTGYGRDEDRRRAREAGIDEHLVKPVGRAVIEALILARANQN
jgi:signal transduction histidine kinase/DNA-binding response OmpR family regulator